MSKLTQRIAKNAFIMSSGTLLSRILGYTRDVVTAFALGTGPFMDAFIVAFRLPNLLRRLFAEGSLTMAFVPVFTKTREKMGKEQAFALARSVQVWLLLILGCLVVLAFIYARPLTKLIALGWQNDPFIFEVTVILVQICFPYILFISSVALCMGILNSMDHFLAPALAPCILNISLIATALFGYFTQYNIALCMSFGVLAGGLGQWWLQQPFLRKKGFRWRGPWKANDPGVRRIGWVMLPMVLGASVYQLNIVIGTLLASFLPFGSMSSLYYADRLVQFPYGVFGVAVGTATLPSLSTLAAPHKRGEFKSTLSFSVGLTLFISLPAAVGLISLSEPVISLLFERGAFTQTSTLATSLALMGYALGLPAMSCIRPLTSAFYAMEDSKTPMIVASLCLTAYVALGYVLMQKLLLVGLALATSISLWMNVLLLGWLMKRKVGQWLEPGKSLRGMLVLSLLLMLGTLATAQHTVLAIVLIPFWAVVYLWTANMMQLPEAKTTLDILNRVKNRIVKKKTR